MPKKIYISPSDQGKNTYAAGDTNEEVQCERIAIELEKALIRCGFEVINNMTDSMAARVAESNEWGADLHLSIHTNGFNAKVTGTRLMSYDLVGEGYKACIAIFKYLAPLTPGISENISAHPELYEVRNSLAPCAYVEVDFHDVPDVALWIISHTTEIAEAICHGICDHYGYEYVVPEQGDDENRILAGEEEDGMRYHTLGDLKADKVYGAAYLPTIEKLIRKGYLYGKGGEGDELILDLGEDAIRVMVTLDRAGIYGE